MNGYIQKRSGNYPSALQLLIATLLCLAGLNSCSFSRTTRIGPPVPSRGQNCDLEVLSEGQTPSRPFRDIGMVTLKNCEDYLTPPCIGWLKKEACTLGGHVAYLPPKARPDSNLGGVEFQVMVGAYIAELNPLTVDDPLLKSRTCTPACSATEKCVNRKCVPKTEAECDAPKTETPPAEGQGTKDAEDQKTQEAEGQKAQETQGQKTQEAEPPIEKCVE